MFQIPRIPVDVTRSSSGFRSRANYFVSSFTSLPQMKLGMCYTENHTGRYYKPHSAQGFVGSSSTASRAMKRRV
jgi:hypothetical protein